MGRLKLQKTHFKRLLRIAILAPAILAVLVGCAPQNSAPSVDNPSPSGVNIEGCRNATFSFQTFTASNVKALVDCLNGSTKAVQPVKDFLDSAREEDLNQLLQALNLHWPWGSVRQQQVLDLIQVMEKQGYLKALIRNYEVWARTGLITHAAKASIVAFANNSTAHPDPNITSIARFLTRSIDSGLQSRILDSMSLFNLPRAHAMADLLSAVAPAGSLTASQVADTLSVAINNMITDDSLRPVIAYLGDPKLMMTLNNTNPQDRTGLNDIFTYFSLHRENNYQLFRRNQIVVRAGDQGIVCFSGQSARYNENILHFLVDQIKGKSRAENDTFLLQTVPLLLSASKNFCNMPADLTNNYDALTQIAQDGYSESLGRFWTVVSGSPRYDVLVSAFKSSHFADFNPTIDELSTRTALRVFWDFLGDDLKISDAQNFSEMLTRMIADSISDSTLDQWINTHFSVKSKSTKGPHDYLVTLASRLPKGQKNLSSLMMAVQNDPGQDDVALQMRAILASESYAGSAGLALQDILKRVLSNDSFQKDQVRALAQSLAAVWGDSSGGFGEAIKVLNDVNRLTTQSPFADFVRDVLADEDYLNGASPALVRLLQNPKFDGAVNYMGTLARTGDLEKILVFFVDLLKQGSQPKSAGLQIKNPSSYKPSGIEGATLASFYLAQRKAMPRGTYDACLNLKGDLFEPTGSVLNQAALCLNSTGGNAEFLSSVNTLKSAGLLPQTSQVLGRMVKDSPTFPSTVDQIETLFRSGHLDSLLNLFSLVSNAKYKIMDKVDATVAALFSNSKIDSAMQILGWVTQQKNISKNLTTLVDLTSNTPTPVFTIDPNFRLKVSDPNGIKNQLATYYSGYTTAEIQKFYDVARENFETHNDNWYYQEGNYTRLTKSQFKALVIQLITGLLRTTDLEEFLKALQDIGRDGSAIDFAKFLSQWQMVVYNYGQDGVPRPHIMSGLDALESLVLNADFGYAYVGNIGTTFQLAVEKSTDYVATMNDQLKQLQLGESISGIPLLGNSEKNKKFKNMLGAFPVLTQIAQNKQMRVLQRQYQALKKATPDADKENQDPNVNHMGLVNIINKLGFFSNLTMGYQAAAAQGKADAISHAFTNLLIKIKPEDIASLRSALKNLLDQYNAGGANPLDHAMDLFWDMSQNTDPVPYQKFKAHLFHLALAEDAVFDNISQVLKALPDLTAHPRAMTRVFDMVFSDLQNDSSLIYKLSANLISLDIASFVDTKTFLGGLLAQPTMADTLSVVGQAYDSNPSLFDSLSQALTDFSNAPEVVALKPSGILKQVLLDISSDHQLGVWPSAAFVLNDAQTRGNLEKVSLTLSQGGQLKGLSQLVSRKYQSGDIDSGLKFLFDHFKKDSIKFHSRMR